MECLENFDLFLSAFCYLPCLSGCAGKSTVNVNESQNGSSVDLQTGDMLVITLDGNPTTGYQWEMLPNTDGIVELQGDPEYKSGGNLVGSGGKYSLM